MYVCKKRHVIAKSQRDSLLGYFVIDRYENFEGGRHGGKVGTINYAGKI